jgi:hypothetical protein
MSTIRRFSKPRHFRLRVRLGSIFWRPLVIKEVALVAPTVIWPQNESGEMASADG